MAERLGRVLYVGFCIIAVLLFVGGVALAMDQPRDMWVWAAAGTVAACVSWAIGYAARYILSG